MDTVRHPRVSRPRNHPLQGNKGREGEKGEGEGGEGEREGRVRRCKGVVHLRATVFLAPLSQSENIHSVTMLTFLLLGSSLPSSSLPPPRLLSPFLLSPFLLLGSSSLPPLSLLLGSSLPSSSAPPPCLGLQQGSGLVGSRGADLRDGGWLSSLLC